MGCNRHVDSCAAMWHACGGIPCGKTVEEDGSNIAAGGTVR